MDVMIRSRNNKKTQKGKKIVHGPRYIHIAHLLVTLTFLSGYESFVRSEPYHHFLHSAQRVYSRYEFVVVVYVCT